MTAQVFFVASSAKDAVLVPVPALRPATAAEGQPRKPRASGAGTGEGAARKGGGERASGIDPRSQYANGRALVSVVGADGEVAEREVKVGVMNRVSAQILSGLEPGEKVVIGTKAPAAAAPAQTGSALVPNAPKTGGRPSTMEAGVRAPSNGAFPNPRTPARILRMLRELPSIQSACR